MPLLRTLLILTLATAAIATEPSTKEAVTFRLKKSPRVFVRGWALEVDTDGIRFEAFGDSRRSVVPWDALVREDARRLRLHFEIDWLKNVVVEKVAGHRLLLLGGGSVDGLLVRVDEKKRHWLRTAGMLLPYPGDRIRKVEERELDETAVWNKEEIYLRRLERRPPRTAAEHRDLADYMFDLGNWAKAVEHYRAAAKIQELWAPEVNGRVTEVLDILQDARASKAFSKAKYWASMHGDYPRALALIEDYVAKHPDATRRGAKVTEQISELRWRKLGQRYHRAKNEAFDRVVKRYLSRMKPDHATAVAWVKKSLADEIRARVRRRLNLTAEEFEELRKTRASGAPHFATYWSGTFIIHKRGKAKGKHPRHSADSWWTVYDNTGSRATWLKAYAAERLPELFEVVQVRFSDCERCGGKGHVRMLNLNPRGNQPMEWNEKCPRCFGARRDRGVAYR